MQIRTDGSRLVANPGLPRWSSWRKKISFPEKCLLVANGHNHSDAPKDVRHFLLCFILILTATGRQPSQSATLPIFFSKECPYKFNSTWLRAKVTVCPSERDFRAENNSSFSQRVFPSNIQAGCVTSRKQEDKKSSGDTPYFRADYTGIGYLWEWVHVEIMQTEEEYFRPTST